MAWCALALLAPHSVWAQLVPEDTPIPLWGTNGEVRALARVGNTLFVGGKFDVVGPPTGGFATAEAGNATAVITTSGVGTVNLIAGDGAGGWYAAQWSGIGTGPVIHHLRADGTRSPAWVPPTFDSGASLGGLVTEGGRVFVSGQFGSVNGATHRYVVALDGTSGSVLPWAPALRSGGVLGDPPRLTAAPGRLYLAYKAFLPNQTLFDVIAVDPTSGALLPFQVSPPAAGYAFDRIATSNGRVVIAYRGCGTLPDADAVCGFDEQGQRLWSWAPPTGTSSYGLWMTADRVYVVQRDPEVVVPLDAETGTPLPWTLSTSGVSDLADDGARIYVAANLPNVTSGALLAFDRTTGMPVPWDPVVGAGVMSVRVAGGRVAVGGAFRTVGGVRRSNLVAFDLRSGGLATPTPQPSGQVNALAVYGDIVFGANGTPNQEVFAFSAATGTRLPWGLQPNGQPWALAVARQTLYIGGFFSELSGVARSFLASVDLRSGALTPWNPRPGFDVRELTASPTSLYVAGRTAGLGPQLTRATGHDLETGDTLPFNPPLVSVFDGVRHLATAMGRVLATFRFLGPPRAVGVSWLDATNGNVQGDIAMPFLPTAAAGVGDTLVIGGRPDFGPPVMSLTSMHVPTGRLSAWSPMASVTPGNAPGIGPGFTILAEPDLVAIGGPFDTMAGRAAANVAVFRARAPGPPVQITRTLVGNTLTLAWVAGAAPPPTAFVVEAGTTPGGVDIGRFDIGPSTRVSGTLPAGTYYLRLRSIGTAGEGAPSSELITTVPDTSAPPSPPGTLSASVANGVVTLAWGAASGNATTYVIEAGTASGLANVGVLPTGVLDTTFSTPAPSGTYFVRVRAANAVGQSSPTNEVIVVVP